MRIHGRVIFIIVLLLAIVSIIASFQVKASAYSTPPVKEMSALCQRLTDGKVNIEPFVEYLDGMQSSKAKALASLDQRIHLLSQAHSTNAIIARSITQERRGLMKAKARFIAGTMTLGNASAYITSNVRAACGAQA
jgi:hypothetical protein